jgi:hypothetical protein
MTMGQMAEGFVGNVGERLDLTVTLERIRAVKTREGGFCRVYEFVDEHGRRFSWISDAGVNSWHQGKTFNVRGTVKRHAQVGRQQVTDLTRLMILGEVAMGTRLSQDLTNTEETCAQAAGGATRVKQENQNGV